MTSSLPVRTGTLSGEKWRRFAKSTCPVRTRTLSFVLNQLRRSFSQTHHLADLAQTELFGERCVFEKIGEAGRFVTLHIPRTDIPQEVVIAGCWFLANYAA